MDFLQSALDSQELMHYGVLGQKWGERRYQNYDGTLTDEGRVHYARKDLRKETHIRRGIAASKRDLKDAAKLANEYKKAYDDKVSEYQKEKNKIRLFGLGGKNTRETDINNAMYRMNKAKERLNEKDVGVRMALKNLNDYDKRYQRFTEEMIDKYGSTNVGELRRKTFKASKAYRYDNVIDPGLTMVDLPIIGQQIGKKYTNFNSRKREKVLR